MDAEQAAPARVPGPTGPTAVRVREAALDLFAERGYHGTGIRQLAEHAGVSSATLYHYMGTKEELLVALMREALERLVGLAERLGQTPDPLERLAALVRMHVREHAERPRETRVVDDQIAVLGESARREVVALRDRYEDVWRRCLEDAAATGRVPDVDLGLQRRALLEMCTGVAHWYRADGALSLDELAEAHAALALRLVGVTGPGSEAT